MKKVLWVLLIIGLVGCAPHSPDSVTDTQILSLQTGVFDECIGSQAQRDIDPEKAKSYCGCMVNAMKTELSHSEWQRAYIYDRQNDKAHENELILAHSDTDSDKFRACQHSLR